MITSSKAPFHGQSTRKKGLRIFYQFSKNLCFIVNVLAKGEIVESDHQSKSIGDETDGESVKEEQTRAFCFRYLSR